VLRTARRGLTAVAVVALAASLSACGAGKGAQTNQYYMPASGRNVNVPSQTSYHEPFMAIRNTVLVTSNRNPALSSLVVSFVNNNVDDDALTGVSINGVTQRVPRGEVPLPNRQIVTVGSLTSNYFIAVRGISSKPGDWVEVTLTFRNAARATFSILQLPQINEYAQVPVLPVSIARPLAGGLTG
jgi:hypothetical protein